jgi:hypothetical protein
MNVLLGAVQVAGAWTEVRLGNMQAFGLWTEGSGGEQSLGTGPGSMRCEHSTIVEGCRIDAEKSQKHRDN